MNKININLEFEYEVIFEPTPREVIEDFEKKDNGQKLLEEYKKKVEKSRIDVIKNEEEESMEKLKKYFMDNKRFKPSFFKYRINVK